MKIYISGKISGLDSDAVIHKFWESYRYASTLASFSDIKNPLSIKPLFDIKKWFFYMISDIRQLLKCDAVLLQPDWINSKGAKIEVLVSILTNKQILTEK